MTIEVSGPNGVRVSFPDGTDAAVINSVMMQHFGGGKPPEAPAVIPGAGELAKAPIGGPGSGDVGAKALEGIPILGGFVPRAGAAISAAVNPLTGAGEQGGSFGERYGRNLAVETARSAAMEKEHPGVSMAAGLLGGTAATLPIAATGIGAAALGLGGRTLATQTGRGIASGAGINALDALTRGQDPLAGAGVGAIIGGALPGAGRLLEAAAAPALSAYRGIVNPAEEAMRRVGGAIDRDIRTTGPGLSPQEFAAAQQAGSPVNLMDVGGETTRAVARSAANTSPEGRQLLNNAINDRFASQSGRLEDWARQGLHYPDAVSQQAAMEQAKRATNNAAYRQAMQDGAGGIWSPELERLAGSDAVSAAMKRAASTAKDEAIVGGYGAMNPRITFTQDGRIQFNRGPNGVPTYPDLAYWDLVRRDLSNSANMARRSGDEEGYRRFSNFAGRMNDALDAQVPSYASARAGAAAHFGAENAFEAGTSFVTSRMGNPEARAALARMSPSERRLFQDGYVQQFVQQVRESGDRRAFINTVRDSPAKRERLDMVLGPQRARELEALVRTEGIMDLARGAVQGNSTTARQLAELGLAGGAYTFGTGGNILNPDPTSIMNAALVYGAARGRHAIDNRVSLQVARLLTSNDPRALANGMRLLSRNNSYLGALRHADVGLARAAALEATNR